MQMVIPCMLEKDQFRLRRYLQIETSKSPFPNDNTNMFSAFVALERSLTKLLAQCYNMSCSLQLPLACLHAARLIYHDRSSAGDNRQATSTR